MATICGAVIARDEEHNIGRCLESLRWADSLLVILDDRTADRTAEIARIRGARVEMRTFVDYARQRNAALQAADCDWVLFVDADEVITPELAAEVSEIIARGNLAAPGYWIPRRNIIFGRWVRHAGWSPDYQLRLLRRGDARYQEERTVHELVDLNGEAGYLRTPMVHYNYVRLGEFLAKQRRYSSMEAADMHRRGVRVKPQNYLLQPWRQFWRRYITLRGFRDGGLGLLLSVLLAFYEFRTYVKLGSLWKQGAPEASSSSPQPH